MARHTSDSTIADNRKARHEYFIEDTLEAGMSLQGWEVKSMREGRVQLKESYIIVHQGEMFLYGAHISPLATASTHNENKPTRNRKLLLKRKEIDNLIGKIDQKGYTLIPLQLYWSRGNVKLKMALAKGKKQHDKRDSIRDREMDRTQSRILKHHQNS